MAAGGRESFVRWQERSIKQLEFVNNLLIGLAAGLLAFQTQLAFNDKVSLTPVEKLCAIPSMILIYISLAIGCYVAWNRLRCFHATSQIARKRETNRRDNINELRALVKSWDKKTWQLLTWQTILFAVGGVLLLLTSLIRYLK